MHLQWVSQTSTSWMDGRICTNKQKAASENTNHLGPATETKQFKYFFLPADSPMDLTENIITEKNIHKSQSTFCRSSCSFLSMASSCDTFSSRWPGESLQQRDAVTLRQKQITVTVCNRKTHKWKPKCQNGLVFQASNQQGEWLHWYLQHFKERCFLYFFCLSYRGNFSICLIGCGAVCHSGSCRHRLCCL